MLFIFVPKSEALFPKSVAVFPKNPPTLPKKLDFSGLLPCISNLGSSFIFPLLFLLLLLLLLSK